jgi:hypothetical protein
MVSGQRRSGIAAVRWTKPDLQIPNRPKQGLRPGYLLDPGVIFVGSEQSFTRLALYRVAPASSSVEVPHWKK